MDALVATPGAELLERLSSVEKENSSLHGSKFFFPQFSSLTKKYLINFHINQQKLMI